MTNDPQSELLVDNFAQLVQRYCDWAVSPFGDSHEEMLTARELLAEIHLAIIKLPDLESDEEWEDVNLSDEQRLVVSRFENLPVNDYWDAFDPLIEEAPVFNRLCDDLADIYRDLKGGLLLYKDGKIAEAVCEWKVHFNIHWGRHLTSAQRAIYSYFS